MGDLKKSLDEEHLLGDPKRSEVHYFGIAIDDNVSLADIIEEGFGGAFFTLTLPKASVDKKKQSSNGLVKINSTEATTSPRFIITGSQKKFKAILLTPNRQHSVPLDKGVKKRGFGISYCVEGTELGNRRYHVDQFPVSDSAESVQVILDKEGVQAKAVEFAAGQDREVQPVSNMFDESEIDRESGIDKAVKISQIIANIGQFVSNIAGGGS